MQAVGVNTVRLHTYTPSSPFILSSLSTPSSPFTPSSPLLPSPTPLRSAEAPPSQEALHVHLLLEFALQLLQGVLRTACQGRPNPDTLAMLDPLLPLVVKCLGCRHASTVSMALKCMAQLITLPLPGGHV